MTEAIFQQSAKTAPRGGRGWLRTQGYTALANVTALVAVLLIFALILQHRVYWAKSLFAFRDRYFIACVLVVVLAIAVTYVIYKGGRGMNRCLCILFLLTLCFAEFGAHYATLRRPFRMQFRKPHPYLGFTGKTGQQEIDTLLALRMGGTEADAPIQLNELGYRGSLPPKNKHDEYRIIMVGGSTVFVGSPKEKSIPHQLEFFLAKAGVRDVRVYNWGIVSAVSGQELAAIAYRAIAFNPDMIIVYDGANDVSAPFTYDPRPGYPFNYFLAEMGQKFMDRGITTPQIISVLLQKSRTMSALLGDCISLEANHLAAIRRLCGYGTQAWRDQIADTYGQNLSSMSASCKGNGSKMAVFLQPLFINKSHAIKAETTIEVPNALNKHMQDTYPRMAMAAIRVLEGREDEGIYFSDMSHVLEDVEEELFWDHIHVNNRGNELIARDMATRVLPMIDQHTACVANATKAPSSAIISHARPQS